MPFARDVQSDGDRLRLRTPTGTELFRIALTRGAMGYSFANTLILRLAGAPRWILFAPYVPPGIGKRLAANGANYIDTVGNCHLSIDGHYFVHVEGKRPGQERHGHRALRGPGLKVLLALLADRELAKAPVRELAEQAGAGKSTASNVLRQLRDDGRLIVTGTSVHLKDSLWDTFAVGYGESLRSSWVHGRFRAQDKDLAALEERFARTLSDELTWAWGGGAAADRLTSYYHGPEVMLHLATIPDGLPQRLRLLGAQDGPIVLVRTPCPAAFHAPVPDVVAPVLAYAELVYMGGDRALETAALVRERYQEVS